MSSAKISEAMRILDIVLERYLTGASARELENLRKALNAIS